MVESVAKKYINAWANNVGADIRDLKQGEDGDLFGQLGSLCFEYLARRGVLLARAYIFPYSTSFTSKEDLLPWLNRIAAEDPDSVSRGIFETARPRWEPDKEPSLFLRIEIEDGDLPEPAVLSIFKKLREDSMIWRRVKLTESLGELVKRRRQMQ